MSHSPEVARLVVARADCTCGDCRARRLFERAVRLHAGALLVAAGWPAMGALLSEGSLPWEAALEILRRPAPVWHSTRWRAVGAAAVHMAAGEIRAAVTSLSSFEGMEARAWVDRELAAETAREIGAREGASS